MPRRFLESLTLALAVIAAGCGGGSDLVLPNEGVPTSITVLKGNQQTAPVGAVLPDSVVVRVTDTMGRPVVGQQVVFLTGANNGAVHPDTVATNADGRAAARWTLGAMAGAQSLTARVIGPNAPQNLAASISATAGAGGAATIAAQSGDAQAATAGSLLRDSLVIVVKDANGNPVQGIAVEWTVTGGGSVSAPSVVTGPDGHAAVLRTLGSTAGNQTTVATLAGVNGSPVTFTATATVGAAGRLTITTPPSSSAASGAPFAQQPRLQLRDANGNPVSQAGVAVTATIASGSGGTLVGNSTTATDASGLATFSGLGISGAGGTYTLNFGGAGLSGVSSGSITITAGSASQLGMVTQPSATAQSGTVFAQQPVVQLRDASGNAVGGAGVVVTASIASGGGTLGGTTSRATDASGRATFTDLSISGAAGTRTIAFFAGSAVVTSSPILITAAPPPPPSVSASQSSVTASPSTITAGGATSTITVIARDASGNPVSGASVSLSVTGAGNTVTAPSATDANGRTTATLSSTSAGTKTVTATAGGVTLTQVATITVTAGAPSGSASTISASPTAVSTIQPSTVTVTVLDANGNPVSGATVTLASSGGTISQPSAPTNAAGVTSGSIVWTTGGTKTVSATINGSIAVTQTASVTVTAPTPTVSGARSTLTVSPSTISAGATTTATVTARDANSAPIAGVTVTLAATGTDNTITPASQQTDANGVAAFSFSSTRAETKTLSATAGGVTVSQTATVAVQPAAASAAQSTATVPNGTRGRVTTFTVRLRDAYGNNLTTSGGTVTATITGKNAGATVTITDSQDGIYTGRYTPTASGNGGTDFVNIFLNGTPISGSPYTSLLG